MLFSRNLCGCGFYTVTTFVLLQYLTAVPASNIKLFEFRVHEEQPPNTIVGGIRESQDLAKEFGDSVLPQLRFSFRSSAENYRLFAINQSTGIIRTSRKLDREQICPSAPNCNLSLDVNVRAPNDFHIIKIVITIVDINDNSPTFHQPHLSIDIQENAVPGTLFALPSAEDADSGSFAIQDYRLVPAIDKFQLILRRKYDNSLEVRLNLTKHLDHETKNYYSMTLVAVDGGNPPKSGSVALDIIVVDSNDNSPQFELPSYEVRVLESLPTGSTVIHVKATDADDGLNGMIVYSFTDYTETDHGKQFGINNQTGEIFLKRSLDYEQKHNIQLTVVASDLGTGSLPSYAKVNVVVLDENDNSPQFTLNPLTSSGLVEVSENSEPGFIAAFVFVKDVDSGSGGEVECSLDTELFRLEPTSGSEYKLRTAVSFDRENKSEYVVMMTCFDKGNPARDSTLAINVSILDENDNTPLLRTDTFVVEILEGNMVGVLVYSFNATDEDAGQNGLLQYAVDESARETLGIDSSTGKVFARITFDYETKSEYIHQLTVSDCGEDALSTSATFILRIIDFNDEPPRFDRTFYHFSIQENLPLGTVVGKVIAHDADINPAFNKITYSIKHINNAVEIDASTGAVLTTKRIDREDTAILEFSVMAENEGFPAMRNFVNVSVFVEDENDNSPLITYPSKTNHMIHLSSQTAVGSFIVRISATDPDAGLNAKLVYAIANGNEQETFTIDEKTGAISVKESLPKGVEMTYWLVITVRDCGTPELMSTSDLIIHVNSSTAAETNKLSPQSGEATQPVVGEKFIILAATVCSVVLVLVLLFTFIFFFWRHKQKARTRMLQMELDARTTPCSELSLKRPLSSMYYAGSRISQKSLGSQSVTIRCRECMNDTASGTERDESEDDSSHVTSMFLRKEHHPNAEMMTHYPHTSDSNLQTLDVLPAMRPASCSSQHSRSRRKRPSQGRSKAVHSRSGSKSNARRHHSCRSDNEIIGIHRNQRRSRVSDGSGFGVNGSGSECSGSYFDSGMDPSEDSDNRHRVSQSS